jgi:hypothetical protein
MSTEEEKRYLVLVFGKVKILRCAQDETQPINRIMKKMSGAYCKRCLKGNLFWGFRIAFMGSPVTSARGFTQ